jgi:hypothetical protein
MLTRLVLATILWLCTRSQGLRNLCACFWCWVQISTAAMTHLPLAHRALLQQGYGAGYGNAPEVTVTIRVITYLSDDIVCGTCDMRRRRLGTVFEAGPLGYWLFYQRAAAADTAPSTKSRVAGIRGMHTMWSSIAGAGAVCWPCPGLCYCCLIQHVAPAQCACPFLDPDLPLATSVCGMPH